MADFRLWARIEHLAPDEFLVIVTAVAVECAGAQPITRMQNSRTAAEDLQREMLRQIKSSIADRGDRVVDVETD